MLTSFFPCGRTYISIFAKRCCIPTASHPPEEWLKDPSRKLNALVEILSWHLGKDGRAPLEVVDDKLTPRANNPPPVVQLPKGTPCDKIVISCAFPSSYIQLVKVSARFPSFSVFSLASFDSRCSTYTVSRASRYMAR
jgi:hypothetical protein